MKNIYRRPENKKAKSLYLDIDTAKKAEEISWQMRRSFNSVLEEALKEWLEKHCK